MKKGFLQQAGEQRLVDLPAGRPSAVLIKSPGVMLGKPGIKQHVRRAGIEAHHGALLFLRKPCKIGKAAQIQHELFALALPKQRLVERGR